MNDDHYHWLTSLVASRHLEKPTCRLIAATAFLLGVIPLLLVRHQPDPPVTSVVIASAIMLCCTGIAAIWATRCWPSRSQSRASAVAATACVAAAVAVIPDPLVAALGTVAFAGPAGFTALFHTRRLMVGTWAIGAITVTLAAWRLAAVNPVLAVAVVPLVVLINVFAGFAWMLVMHLTDAKVSSALIDPTTGLLNQAGFTHRAATLLGSRDRQHDRHLIIAVIGIDAHGFLMSLGQRSRANSAAVTAAGLLRDTVRRDTLLAHRGDANFLIGELFDTTDPTPMLERLRSTLTDRHDSLHASIGAVSTPLTPLTVHPVDDVLTELLKLADQARHHARQAGGDTVRCIIDPKLDLFDT